MPTAASAAQQRGWGGTALPPAPSESRTQHPLQLGPLGGGAQAAQQGRLHWDSVQKEAHSPLPHPGAGGLCPQQCPPLHSLQPAHLNHSEEF